MCGWLRVDSVVPTVPDSRDAMQVDTDGEAFMDEQQDSQRRMLMEDQKSNPMSP